MNRLTQSLADVCRQHLLAEKWLVAPSLRVGHQWLETVARGGQPAVNVHIKTVKSLAIDLAAPEMASRGVTLVTNRASALLIDRVIRNLHGGQLQYLASVEPSAGVAATLLSTIDAVRMSGLDVTTLALDEFEARINDITMRRIIAESSTASTFFIWISIFRHPCSANGCESRSPASAIRSSRWTRAATSRS